MRCALYRVDDMSVVFLAARWSEVEGAAAAESFVLLRWRHPQCHIVFQVMRFVVALTMFIVDFWSVVRAVVVPKLFPAVEN